MFIFPKAASDLTSNYRKLIDGDARDHLKSPDTKTVTPPAKFQSFRTVFYGLLILSVLAITLTLTVSQFRNGPQILDIARSPWRAIPHDQVINFTPDENFEASNSGMSAKDPWGSLLPAGRGFIEVPVEIPLPNGGTVVEKHYYCISMFHQLHCIASLKVAFEAMSAGEHEMHDHPIEHLSHCFDYLRQAVMCAGDMTLEPAEELKKLKVKVVDGWNVKHQCRNWKMMYDFAESHRYLNSSGIL